MQPAYHLDGGHPFLECTARGPPGTVLTALASKSRSPCWREAGPAKQLDAGALGHDPGAGAQAAAGGGSFSSGEAPGRTRGRGMDGGGALVEGWSLQEGAGPQRRAGSGRGVSHTRQLGRRQQRQRQRQAPPGRVGARGLRQAPAASLIRSLAFRPAAGPGSPRCTREAPQLAAARTGQGRSPRGWGRWVRACAAGGAWSSALGDPGPYETRL